MPSVVDFLRDFRADLISEEQSQMRLMARHWLAVEDHLSSAIDQAAQAAANAAKNGQAVSQSQLFQLQRWNELLVATRAEIETYNQWAENQITQQQQNIAAETMDRASTAIELAAADAGSVIGSFNTLPVEAVEFMIGNTADGSPLRQLMDKAWPEAADAMARILVQNTAAGINPRKTARAMMDQGLATGLNRLLNIARTEQLRVFREASREQYQASGVVRGYKRISARDDRVCPACLFSDGEFYEVDTPLDEHPSGRCGMVPVVIGLPEPEWESGKDWFENQDEQTQRNILGPGAFNLWKENGFNLSAFVSRITNPIWGDSLQATSLKSLRDLIRSGSTPIAPPPAPVIQQPERNFVEIEEGPAATRLARNLIPREAFSPAELSALHDYKGAGYYDINQILRKPNSSQYTEKTRARLKKQIDSIDSAFFSGDSSGLPRDMMLFRGLGSGILPAQSLVGGVIQDKGFISTTTSRGFAEEWDSSVILEIRAPEGSAAIGMAALYVDEEDREYEILLPRGTRFRVISDSYDETGPDTRTLVVELLWDD